MQIMRISFLECAIFLKGLFEIVKICMFSSFFLQVESNYIYEMSLIDTFSRI